MSRAEYLEAHGWQLRWLFVGGGSVATVALGKLFVSNAVSVDAAVRWALVVCPLLAFEAWFFYTRRTEQVPTSVISVPNAVTMVRGWLYAAAGGFVVLQPAPGIAWYPALCYGGGVVLDQLDGRIARYTNAESRLGAQLDMAFDTLGFLVAPAVAVAWGRLPVWYLLLPAAQYAFRLARELRRWRGLPVSDLPPSGRRRRLSGAQMVFLTVALLPVVPGEPLAVVAAPLLALSLGMFGRDYLAIAGHVGKADTDGPRSPR